MPLIFSYDRKIRRPLFPTLLVSTQVSLKIECFIYIFIEINIIRKINFIKIIYGIYEHPVKVMVLKVSYSFRYEENSIFLRDSCMLPRGPLQKAYDVIVITRCYNRSKGFYRKFYVTNRDSTSSTTNISKRTVNDFRWMLNVNTSHNDLRFTLVFNTNQHIVRVHE